MSSKKPTKVDPELTRQLDEADPADAPVQVVVHFRSSGKRGPTGVTEVAEAAIGSATSKAGTGPIRVNVMRYLGVMSVEAPASFVRALLDEEDVESALANVHPGDDDPGLGVPSKPPEVAAVGTADEPAAPGRPEVAPEP